MTRVGVGSPSSSEPCLVFVVVLVVVVFVVVVVVVRGDAVRAREHESFAEVDAASAGNEGRRADGVARDALEGVAKRFGGSRGVGRHGTARDATANLATPRRTASSTVDARTVATNAAHSSRTRRSASARSGLRRADILPRALETRAGRRELQPRSDADENQPSGASRSDTPSRARALAAARGMVWEGCGRGAESSGRAPKRESTTVA